MITMAYSPTESTICAQVEEHLRASLGPGSPKKVPGEVPADIWILTDNNDAKTIVSANKIFRALNERIPGRVKTVLEETLLMKMSMDGLSLFLNGNHVPRLPKLVITRMHSGYLNVDFQVTLLKQLEMMGIVVVNNSNAVQLCIHKVLHLQVLACHGIPMPPTLTYSTKNLMKVEETVVGREIGYPHVMKGVNGNRGKLRNDTSGLPHPSPRTSCTQRVFASIHVSIQSLNILSC